MKCPNCGGEGTGKFCEYCGSELPKNAPDQVVNDNSQTVINNYYFSGTPDSVHTYNNVASGNAEVQTNSNLGVYPNTNVASGDANKIVALILCIFLGYLGGHYFYVKRFGMGILYLCTMGLLGIGVLIDIIRIIAGTFPGLANDGTPSIISKLDEKEVSVGPIKNKKTLFTILFVIGVIFFFAGLDGSSWYVGLLIAGVSGYLWKREKDKL